MLSARWLFFRLLLQGLSAAATDDKPYLLVIGIDAMRPDFVDRYGATNLQRFRAAGVGATALIPSFPSSTFPNFYTIATGLAPENHGVVDMKFFESSQGDGFDYRTAAKGTKWYRGVPIWLLAERQGLKSATFSWVGSEAKIGGQDPTYSRPYNPRTTHEERVAQIKEWLEMPEEKRPQLVMTYFSDIDAAGHAFGPESDQVGEAVRRVDESVGKLLRIVEKVRPAVNVIVVSDHGMDSCGRLEGLGAEPSTFRVSNGGHFIRLYAKDPRAVDGAYRELREKQGDRYRVYRRQETPRHLRHRNDPRIGDLLLIAEPGKMIAFLPPGMTEEQAREFIPKGCHGQDATRNPKMNGIFYARGPHIRSGVRLGNVSNLEVFPVMTRILGLEPGKVDGSGRVARKMVRAPGGRIRAGL